MFGYIMPFQPELKVRELQDYRAYYCGLCKELKREYGFLARLFLNYDLVLLALAADGLRGTAAQACAERCIANPVSKRPVCRSTPGLSLAADALVLTAYYKLVDDLHDEPFFKRIGCLALRPFLERMRKKAAYRRPEMDKLLSQQTQAQSNLEMQAVQSADAAAEPTGQMTACLFAAAAAELPQRHALERFGYFLGKIIYYLDAAEDFDADAKQKGYNVFILQQKSKAEADAAAMQLCHMCAGEASLAYSLLDWKTNKPLLDNILFLGLPHSIQHAGSRQRKRSKI